MSSPLDVLLADGVIDEVLGRLKSGKEADISLVVHRGEVVAAKIYKDRATRSFKNNAEYKEGRKTRNTRTQRAMDSGGRFGKQAAEQAWKSAESTALSRLIAVGVRVPRPVIFYEGVLIMELVPGRRSPPAQPRRHLRVEPGAGDVVGHRPPGQPRDGAARPAPGQPRPLVAVWAEATGSCDPQVARRISGRLSEP